MSFDHLHDSMRKKRSEVAHMSRVHSRCDTDVRFQYRQHGWSPVCMYVNLSHRTHAMTVWKTVSTSLVPLARLSAAWLEERISTITSSSFPTATVSAEPRLEEMSHHDGQREIRALSTSLKPRAIHVRQPGILQHQHAAHVTT